MSEQLLCGTSREDLHALHDGALPLERAAALRTHAETCVACAAELRFLAAVAEGLSGAEAVPPAAWPAIAARLDPHPGRAARRRTLAWAGASLVLAVASAWVIAVDRGATSSADPLSTALGNGSSTEVTSSAVLSYALGGPLAETSDVPDVSGKTP